MLRKRSGVHYFLDLCIQGCNPPVCRSETTSTAKLITLCGRGTERSTMSGTRRRRVPDIVANGVR